MHLHELRQELNRYADPTESLPDALRWAELMGVWAALRPTTPGEYCPIIDDRIALLECRMALEQSRLLMDEARLHFDKAGILTSQLLEQRGVLATWSLSQPAAEAPAETAPDAAPDAAPES